jgi:LCP family protein required for cell wall assembly
MLASGMGRPTSEAPPKTSRLRRVLVVLLVVANVVVFGAYFYLKNIESTFEEVVEVNEDVVAELSPPPSESSDPSTFLLIGSDSRENIPDDFADVFGSAGGQRADVIMLVQVMPDDSVARLLSIPRDLKVDLDGRGTQKINAAYAYGGGSLLVSTVRRVTGLPIHHYVEVDFAGFAAIVDEVGGVTINFPYPARDGKSGLNVAAGSQTLDGETALAFARSRSYEELRGDTWVSTNANDIGRMGRQQDLIFAILSQMKRPSTITQAEEIVSAIGSNLEVDAALIDRGILELAWAMRDIRPGGIETYTYPTTTSIIGGIYYEIPDEPAATETLQLFAALGASAGAPVPETVRLEIRNGNGEPGIAGRWAERMGAEGYVVETIGDAVTFDYATTQVVVPPGRGSIADLIIDSLGFGVAVPGPVSGGVDALVILGSDAS